MYAGFFSCYYDHELGHFQGMCWIFLVWLYPTIRTNFERGGGKRGTGFNPCDFAEE